MKRMALSYRPDAELPNQFLFPPPPAQAGYVVRQPSGAQERRTSIRLDSRLQKSGAGITPFHSSFVIRHS
jgi:hypothetical protein